MKKQGKIALILALLALGLCLGAGAEEAGPAPVLAPPAEERIAGPADLPDSDELLWQYIDQLSFDAGPQIMDHGGEYLTGTTLALYERIKESAAQIADGTAASANTQFTYTAEQLGLKSFYTVGLGPENDIQVSANLYYDPISGGWKGTQAAMDQVVAAVQAMTPDFIAARRWMFVDAQSSLYWFDKTVSVSYSTRLNFTATDSLNFRIPITGIYIQPYTVKFPVGLGYRVGSDDYTADLTKTAAARQSVEKALDIVAANASRTDYQKLNAYQNKLCELTDYNYSAVASGVNPQNFGIDPWQLVWAFDGDPSTKIVCEGYSKAFQYLCDLSTFTRPIECYCVTGALNGGGHMWNLVRMGWKSYMVDVTNSDAGSYSNDRFFMKGGTPSGGNADLYIFSGNRFQYYDGSVTGTVDQAGMYGRELLTLDTKDYTVPPANRPDYYWYTDKQSRFTIRTAEELAGLVVMLRNGDRTFQGKTVVLANDVDLSSIVWPSFTGPAAAFNGTFDGQGHTVTGLSGIGNALFDAIHGGTVKDLAVNGSVCSYALADSLIVECLSLGRPVAASNAGRLQNCCSTGASLVGTNTGTVDNCYYQSAADNDGIPGTYAMTGAQFSSGEVAWSLQTLRSNLPATRHWGQRVGTDTRPILTADPAQSVCCVCFYVNTAIVHMGFTNPGGTVALPDPPTREGELFQRWALQKDLSAGSFTAATAVSADLDVYAVKRSLFGETDADHALSTVYGRALTADLTAFVTYAALDPAEKFTFTLEGVEKDGRSVAGAASVSGDTLSVPAGLAAGSYTLTLRAAEKEGQYSFFSVGAYGAGDVTFSLTLTVEKAPLTITARDQSIVYGQEISVTPARVRAAGLVGGDRLSAVTLTPETTNCPGGKLFPSAAAVHDAQGSDVTDCYAFTYYPGTLTIQKAVPATPAAPGQGAVTYRSVTLTPPALDAEGEPLAEGVRFEYRLGDGPWQSAAVFDALAPNRTCRFAVRLAEGTNYTASAPSQVLEITTPKMPLTGAAVTLPAASYPYIAADLTPAVTVTVDGETVEADQYLVAYSDNRAAGTATVTVTGRGDCEGTAQTTFTILPADLAQAEIVLALPEGGRFVYDGGEHRPAVTLTLSGNPVPGDQYTVTYQDNRTASDSAAVTVAAAGADLSGTARTTFVIDPAPVIARPGSCTVSKRYDGTLDAGSVSGSMVFDGLLTGDDVAVQCTPAPFTSPDVDGQSQIDVTFSLTGGDAENYVLVSSAVSVPCSILPKSARVTAADQRLTYGQTIAQGADQVRASLLLAGHRLADITLTPATLSCPGGIITPSAAVIRDAQDRDVSQNYTLIYNTGRLTVDPKVLAVSGENAALAAGPFVYSAQPQTPAVLWVADGESTVPASEYTVQYENNLLAGTATAVIADAAGGNYTLSGSLTFTIQPRPLTVTAEDKTAYRDRPLPALTFAIEGLAGEDRFTAPVLATAGTGSTGEFPITVQGGELTHAECYTLTYRPGTLTVLPPAALRVPEAPPVWNGTETALPLAVGPGDLLDGEGTRVWAARFESGAMVQIAFGVFSEGEARFPADLTEKTGWKLFFLDRHLVPLCGDLALN